MTWAVACQSGHRRPNLVAGCVLSEWVTIPAMGVVHGEMFFLKDLAADCAADKVFEFFFTAPPLNITHGTGSPINPLAIK